YAQLRGLNMGENFQKDGYPYRGLRGADIPENLKILSVSELFESCRPFPQMRFVIEISAKERHTQRAVSRLALLISQFGLKDRVEVAADGHTAGIIDKNSDLRRTATPSEFAELYLRYVFGAGIKEWQFNTVFVRSSNFFFSTTGARFINYAHKNGLQVFITTDDTEQDIRKQVSRGADAVFSSVPAVAFNVITRG
ncbi:MAG: hypothetical protein PHC84_05300, partial [Clostridia bacterium]|nr:hypothetical protein [Clostridia bacterium]